MKVTVFLSSHWSALQEKALSLWGESKAAALMIVPTTAMRSYWLSVLAERVKGVSGDSVSVLDYLAFKLASSDTDGLFRLASALERKLAAIEARSALSLPEKWLSSGVVEAFINAVEELELHDLSPQSVRTAIPNDPTIQVLTHWWEVWREILHQRGLWSLGDALKFAAEKLREGKIVPPKAQRVLVYGFTALTSARWDFLRALLEAMTSDDQTVYFFVLGDPNNPNAYGYSLPFLNRLKSELEAEVCPLTDNLPEEIQSIPALLFRRHQERGSPELTDRIVCVSVAGEEQEVEMAFRLLVHWRRERQLKRFSDALLVAHSLEPYLPALEAVSARYGVPFVIVNEPIRQHKGLTNLLWAIWNARSTDSDGEALWRVLPSPYLCHPSAPEKPLLPEEKQRDLLSLVRQRLAETGSKQWSEILKGNFPSEQFVDFVADFLHAVEQIPLHAPVSEHVGKWREVLKFVRPICERDEEALQRLRKQLNSLAFWSAELSGEEFVSLLTEGCVEEAKEFSDAVRVASAEDARGQVASVSILLGMADGRFPPSPPMFELLTDKHREILTERLNLTTSLRFKRRPRKFSFATSFAQEQRMLFAEMLGIATERLVFTHPRTDPDGKPIARSIFLDEVEDALKAAGYIWRKEERDLADVVLPEEVKDSAALPQGLKQAIDDREAVVSSFYRAFTGQVELAEDEKALVGATLRNEGFRQRLLTEWQRWAKPQEGEWDGKGLRIDAKLLADRLKEKGLWVTALDDYGHCPYRFFARHILSLRQPREVTYAIDPTTLGSVWHKIVAEFLKVFAQSGEFPEIAVLKQKASEVLESDPTVSQTPQQVRQMLRSRIELALESVWLAEKIQAKDWKPVGVEREFSLPVEDLGDLPEVLREVKLVMRPDRVDVDSEGKCRVADYKTGSAPSHANIRNGVFLQLPLYALALQKAGFTVSRAILLRLLSFRKDKGYKTSCELKEEIDKAMETAKRHALTYLRQMTEANFTVLPFSLNSSCRYCDFKSLCRRHPLRLRERSEETDTEGEGEGT
ncbi:MAG: PD-(D/E)XK nuclease family protein [Armatimonadetes bacterium]|nr:PD-(D/E)XK nuclease family protein [Armatimonadota bacterium]